MINFPPVVDRDKLVRRYRVPAQKLVVESFEQGRSFGVREVIMSAGEIKEMRFYSEARIDNLLKRVEQSNKTLEFFVDRDDYLEYRAVKYDSNDRVCMCVERLTILPQLISVSTKEPKRGHQRVKCSQVYGKVRT